MKTYQKPIVSSKILDNLQFKTQATGCILDCEGSVPQSCSGGTPDTDLGAFCVGGASGEIQANWLVPGIDCSSATGFIITINGQDPNLYCDGPGGFDLDEGAEAIQCGSDGCFIEFDCDVSTSNCSGTVSVSFQGCEGCDMGIVLPIS